MLWLMILLVLLFGGGGGYYGYSRWGAGGGLGILGTVVLAVVLVYWSVAVGCVDRGGSRGPRGNGGWQCRAGKRRSGKLGRAGGSPPFTKGHRHEPPYESYAVGLADRRRSHSCHTAPTELYRRTLLDRHRPDRAIWHRQSAPINPTRDVVRSRRNRKPTHTAVILMERTIAPLSSNDPRWSKGDRHGTGT